MTEPQDRTMRDIGEEAKARANNLLGDARDALQGADKALREASSTPLFGNGLASAMREALKDTEALDETIQALMTRLDEHFRQAPPKEVDRTAAMRGEA